MNCSVNGSFPQQSKQRTIITIRSLAIGFDARECRIYNPLSGRKMQ